MSVPVSVIVVSYNTKALTERALRALFASSVEPAQVIVVDNNSTDGSTAMVREQFPSVVLIENKENLGFAKANNQAIQAHVTEPYVWLLNSDTETGTHSLSQLVQYLETHSDVGAVGPQLVYPDGALQSVGGYFPTALNVLAYFFPVTKLLPRKLRHNVKSIALTPQPIPPAGLELDYVTGAALMLRKKALDEAGLLAEEYFMYFEETDLCYRMMRAGWKRVVIATEPVMHVYGGSYKTKYDEKRLVRFLDSLELFVKKFYAGPERVCITLIVRLLGPLSIWLKKLKNI